MEPSPEPWQALQWFFEWDGSLRDIYVPGTSTEDWQRLLDALRQSPYRVERRSHEATPPLPARAEQIFECEDRPTLAIGAEGLTFHCHFFIEDEIELDLDPREVNTEARFQSLVAFMRFLGDAIAKEVILTPESAQDYIVLRYDPMTRGLTHRTQ